MTAKVESRQLPSVAGSQRDHLFISYASEDALFVEWLALQLAGEGYLVWCDRFQLLGGESYPRDIDLAIRERAFRVLAVMSPSSLRKPNPLRERTLATKLGDERREPFLVPLNLGGLSAADLDWMTSDVTFVPFSGGWPAGLAQLLTLLEREGAPKPRTDARAHIARLIQAQSTRTARAERLVSNAWRLSVPDALWRISGDASALDRACRDRPHQRIDRRSSWFLEKPDEQNGGLRAERVAWRTNSSALDRALRNVVLNLLRQYIDARLASRGLAVWADERGGHRLFFTSDSVPTGWLPLQRPDGTRGRVKAFGERRFRMGADREVTKYHLSPVMAPSLELMEEPVVTLRVRLHLTDAAGVPLAPLKALRRRKKICRSWWNYEWLARASALMEWFCEGHDVNLAVGASTAIVVSSTPIIVDVDSGIDEVGSDPEVYLASDDIELDDDEEADIRDGGVSDE